jgi:hypothetical protein
MPVFVLSNTGQRGRLGAQNPILNGRYKASIDPTPTGSWVEVIFSTPVDEAAGECLDITADAACRVFIGANVPAANEPGWLFNSGSVRTFGVFPGDRFFLKTA